MTKTPKKCRIYRCGSPCTKMGYCDRHYEEFLEKERRLDTAVNFLQTGKVANSRIQNSALQQESVTLLSEWNYCCSVVNSSKNYTVYGQSGDMVLRMLEAIACHIVDEEIAFRSGKPYGGIGPSDRKS